MKLTLELYLDHEPEVNDSVTSQINEYLRRTADTIEHHFLILKMKKQDGTVRDTRGQITGYWDIK